MQALPLSLKVGGRLRIVLHLCNASNYILLSSLTSHTVKWIEPIQVHQLTHIRQLLEANQQQPDISTTGQMAKHTSRIILSSAMPSINDWKDCLTGSRYAGCLCRCWQYCNITIPTKLLTLLVTSCKNPHSNSLGPCGPMSGVLLAFTRWHLLLRYCCCAHGSLLFAATCRRHEF